MANGTSRQQPFRHAFALASALASAVWIIEPARAAEPPSAMIVFDGSGSMWGRLDADKRPAKLDLAREALRTTLTTIPATANVGLMSFGHRRSGDCNDIEIISPVAALTDPARITAPLDKLNPRGKGPVAEALRQAATALDKSNPASIILIHDNGDNCRQDACAAATEIAAAHPKLKINLLSLGMDEDDQARMACVAKSTGGQTFNVASTDMLPAAISGVLKSALLDPTLQQAPAPAKPAAPPPPALPGLTVAAHLSGQSPALAVPVKWRVFKTGSESPVAEAFTPLFSAELPPGNYTVEAAVGFASARKAVDVATGGPTRLDITLEAAALRVSAKDLADGNASTTALVTISADPSSAQRGTRPIWIGQTQDADFVLPAGAYVITINNGNTTRLEPLKLAAGDVVNKDIVMSTGRLELTSSAAPEGPPLEGVTFLIAKDDPDATDGRREIARSSAIAPSFVLPSGTYYLTARLGAAEVRQRIGIGAGDTVKRQISFGLAKLSVTTPLPATAKYPVLTRILNIEGAPREVYRSTTQNPEVNLSAGRYRIEASIPSLNLRSAQDIDLEAGTPRRLALKLDAAALTLKLASPTSAATLAWEMRDAQGTVIWRSNVAQPSLLIPPGRYTARLEVNDRRMEKPVEIAADAQPKTIEFALP